MGGAPAGGRGRSSVDGPVVRPGLDQDELLAVDERHDVAVHADQRGQVVQDVAAGRRVHVDGEHLLLHEVPRRPAGLPAVGGVELLVGGAGAHGGVGGGQGVVDAVDAQPVVGGALAEDVAD